MVQPAANTEWTILLIRVIECVLCLLCLIAHIKALQEEEIMPHIVLFCGTFGGYFILSLAKIFVPISGQLSPPGVDLVFSFTAFVLFYAAACAAMYYAQNDPHLIPTNNQKTVDEATHPFFIHCVRHGKLSLATGTLFLMHAIISADRLSSVLKGNLEEDVEKVLEADEIDIEPDDKITLHLFFLDWLIFIWNTKCCNSIKSICLNCNKRCIEYCKNKHPRYTNKRKRQYRRTRALNTVEFKRVNGITRSTIAPTEFIRNPRRVTHAENKSVFFFIDKEGSSLENLNESLSENPSMSSLKTYSLKPHEELPKKKSTLKKNIDWIDKGNSSKKIQSIRYDSEGPSQILPSLKNKAEPNKSIEEENETRLSNTFWSDQQNTNKIKSKRKVLPQISWIRNEEFINDDNIETFKSKISKLLKRSPTKTKTEETLPEVKSYDVESTKSEPARLCNEPAFNKSKTVKVQLSKKISTFEDATPIQNIQMFDNQTELKNDDIDEDTTWFQKEAQQKNIPSFENEDKPKVITIFGSTFGATDSVPYLLSNTGLIFCNKNQYKKIDENFASVSTPQIVSKNRNTEGSTFSIPDSTSYIKLLAIQGLIPSNTVSTINYLENQTIETELRSSSSTLDSNVYMKSIAGLIPTHQDSKITSQTPKQIRATDQSSMYPIPNQTSYIRSISGLIPFKQDPKIIPSNQITETDESSIYPVIDPTSYIRSIATLISSNENQKVTSKNQMTESDQNQKITSRNQIKDNDQILDTTSVMMSIADLISSKQDPGITSSNQITEIDQRPMYPVPDPTSYIRSIARLLPSNEDPKNTSSKKNTKNDERSIYPVPDPTSYIMSIAGLISSNKDSQIISPNEITEIDQTTENNTLLSTSSGKTEIQREKKQKNN